MGLVEISDMDELRENYKAVLSGVRRAAENSGRKPDEITLVAVSKTHPESLIRLGVKAGIDVFGENYVQELKDKYDSLRELNKKIRWHFIGHLQRNKVKYIAPFVEMIHSVDSERLALEIAKQAAVSNREIDILLQVNTSGENSKSGCEPDAIEELAAKTLGISNINVRGLMTIGSFSEDENIYRAEFSLLRKLSDKLAVKFGSEHFHELSMGMTHDYLAAIQEGATFVRVGTAIFGSRNYGLQ